MAVSKEASALRCERCGAQLPVALGLASVTCRHCGAERRIGQGLQAGLARAVAADAALAMQEIRTRWNAVFHEQSRAATRPFILGVVGSIVMGVYWLVALPFEISVVLAAPLVLFTLGLVYAAASGYRTTMALPTLERLRAVRVVRCSACGGLAAGQGGAPVTACVYCRSSLLVPCDVVGALLHEARSITRATQVRDSAAVRGAYAAGSSLVWPVTLATVAAVLALPLLFLAGYALRAVLPVPTVMLLPIPIVACVWAALTSVRATIRARDARIALEHEIAAIARRVVPAPPPPLSGEGLTARVLTFSREAAYGTLRFDDGHELVFDASICTVWTLEPGDAVFVDVAAIDGASRVTRLWTAAQPAPT